MERTPYTELPVKAQEVLSMLPRKDSAALIALSGELGAGKTSFVQALGKELGITEPMQSPTYVLMKSYPIAYKHFTKLVHIDAYRLESADQFAALKPEAFLADPNTIVCIEWPERVQGALPKADIEIQFSSEGAGEKERLIHILGLRNPEYGRE